MSACPTHYGKFNKLGEASRMLKLMNEQSVTVSQAAKLSPEELKGKLVVGCLKNEPRMITIRNMPGSLKPRKLRIEDEKRNRFEWCRRTRGCFCWRSMGLAASLYEENLNATMSASYGSEARGTFTKTDVIISDGEIGYPNVASPDIILCLAQVAYDRYVDAFRDDTIVFYDSEEVTPKAGAKGEHIGFPYRSEAIALGSIQSANFVALGTMSKKTGLLGAEGCLKAIEDRFGGKKKVVESNQKAFKRGLEL